MKGQIHDIVMQRDLEAILVVLLPHRAEALGHTLGVAVRTAVAYLGTAGHWIPAALCPLNRCESHRLVL